MTPARKMRHGGAWACSGRLGLGGPVCRVLTLLLPVIFSRFLHASFFSSLRRPPPEPIWERSRLIT